MKSNRIINSILAASMLLSLSACGKKDEKKETSAETPAQTEAAVPELDGYNLLWNDEFDGEKMDQSKWNYEPHEPGWTNNELQEYTTSTDNVFVRDGNLVLKAIKTEKDGKEYYTSGKVTGQNKTDFTYGKVVVSAKVPEGQGLWPAIWRMPKDESHYGQWPKCGEIDIMEVLGNQTNIAYGTVHYGEPHAEQQGIYTLDKGTFADDFHEYSIEWEPGEMRWYIDGNLYNTVNDWYTKVDGEEMKDYPAPFNQLFFIQMNLAVGGDWPGNPDETTNFDNAVFQIDYVRVYQKAEYDTDVTRPEQEFRTTTADGNLIWNGDFAEAEPLDDEENWFFLLFYGGEGEAQISDGEMIITSSKAGTEEYSVQLVQPDLPLIQGTTYKLTFEACAEEDRTMIIAVTAPNVGWIRYLKDTKIDLTPDYQEFEFEFTMNDADDNYGRLEFNMGAQGSTSTIYIKNVRIEIVE